MTTLASVRKERGLSQSQLASELGLKSRTTIWAIENGEDAAPELALKIEKWSGGKVRAERLSKLIAEARAA